MRTAAAIEALRSRMTALEARSVRPDTEVDRSLFAWFDPSCPCGLPPGECTTHHRARPAQRPPADPDWLVWLLLAGRGTGKTRSAAELVNHWARTEPGRLIGIVGPTFADMRDVMVTGASGIVRTSPPWFRPDWQPSKRLLSWPNGARAICLSADRSDRVVGHNFSRLWCDEVCLWETPRQTWDMLAMANRIGEDIRVIATTTPRPSKFLTELIESPSTRLTKESTFDNARHLSPQFIEHVKATYGNSRLGRQELFAEIIDVADHVVFSCFDPARNVSEDAAYHPGLPVHVAVDCGFSEVTAAVWFQVRPRGPINAVTVFGELVFDHAKQKAYAEAAARAIRAHGESLPCRGRLDSIRLDPYGASQGGGNGPAALESYEQTFGARFVGRWPGHRVLDGCDTVNLMLDQGLLTITPSCVKLRSALLNHAWKTHRGEPTSIPADEHPHADLCDALRGGIRDKLPMGAKVAPANLRQVQARNLF